MTNEEAIELLKPLTEYSVNENGIGKFPVVSTPSQIEALDLAIKALEEVEDWHKLKLICANEEIFVYKVRGEEE